MLSDTSHKNKATNREAVVELYFDCFQDMLDTLEPQGVKQSRANLDAKYFADWSESFFLYVRPVRIIDDAPPKNFFQTKQGDRDD